MKDTASLCRESGIKRIIILSVSEIFSLLTESFLSIENLNGPRKGLRVFRSDMATF